MELSLDKAIEILDELVKEQGELYVYTSDPKAIETREELGANSATASTNGCYYNHLDGSPGCIIGHLIHKLNPEFDLSSGNTLGTEDVLRNAGIETTYITTGFLLTAQRLQDRGIHWGRAVREARELTGV